MGVGRVIRAGDAVKRPAFKANRIWLGETDVSATQWSITDPTSEALHEALHTARYNLPALTQTQAFLLCSAAEDYVHLTTYALGVEHVIRKLRTIWRALRDRKDTSP